MQAIDALNLMGFRGLGSEEKDPPVEWSRGWEIRFDHHDAIYSAFTRDTGSTLTLKGIRGQAHLEIMCTAWSGMLEVSTQDETVVIDTYSPHHKCRDFLLPGSGERTVVLRLLDTKNEQAHDRQVWIHRLLMQTRPSWQSRHHRITPAITWVDGDFGTFLVLEHDQPVSSNIKYYGSWSATQVDLFEALVVPGSVVADVGANIGHHTVVLSRLVGPNGTVLAFEPQKRVHRILQANLALNACDNVTPFEFALGQEVASAQMFPQDYESGEWNVGGLAVATADGEFQFSDSGLSIEIRRLDHIAGADELDFIKTDTQGFDFAVLQGGAEVIAAARPLLVCEVSPAAIESMGSSYQDMYRFLEDAGYLIAEAESLDFTAPTRVWSGAVDEEWDILAVHRSRSDHLARIKALAP